MMRWQLSYFTSKVQSVEPELRTDSDATVIPHARVLDFIPFQFETLGTSMFFNAEKQVQQIFMEFNIHSLKQNNPAMVK